MQQAQQTERERFWWLNCSASREWIEWAPKSLEFSSLQQISSDLKAISMPTGYVFSNRLNPGSFSGDDGSSGLTSPRVGWGLDLSNQEGLFVIFFGFHMEHVWKYMEYKWTYMANIWNMDNVDWHPPKWMVCEHIGKSIYGWVGGTTSHFRKSPLVHRPTWDGSFEHLRFKQPQMQTSAPANWGDTDLTIRHVDPHHRIQILRPTKNSTKHVDWKIQIQSSQGMVIQSKFGM